MSGGEIVCQGWLRKSPPEKKLRRYAWKKRWFILRSGRMSGDPDVVEYYKNDHSKKPIRVIDLHCCEQVDAGLTFKRKEFQDSFVFDIKTSDRTFYLVAETEDEMNKWVRNICQLCGFNQSEENHDGGRSVASATHGPHPMASELSGSMAPLIGDRRSSAPAHSSQPLLFTFDTPPPRHAHGNLSNSAPQDYLFLHQCLSRKAESPRSSSLSHMTRSNLLFGSDSPMQRVPQGFAHCLNGMGAQLHGFYSLPKPGKHPLSSRTEWTRDACYDHPRALGLDRASRTGHPEQGPEPEEMYIFKTPSNALATSDRLPDNYDIPPTPGSFYQTPRSFDKNHNALEPAAGPESPGLPPPRPPKPSPTPEQGWAEPYSLGACNNGESPPVAAIPRRNTLPAVENIRIHRGSSFETAARHRQVFLNNLRQSVESVNDGFSSYLRKRPPLTNSDSGDSEDNYVPMNPGSSSSPFGPALGESPQNNYIPMSPGPHHFDFPGFSATLPARRGSSASLCHRPVRLSDITPPPINRNLKPDRKSKPTPLDQRTNGIIDELPFKSPVTMSWTRPMAVMNSMGSQHSRPLSTQSITSTDSADSEENYVAMQNPSSTSPAVSSTSSPAPRKCRNVDYLALDFQPGSPGPHRKPSTSSVTSEEKVDYVQVDKEKTQALQNTMQEWTGARLSSETAKALKS
ncbi:hypothetical protein COCON_G00076000 [Conger conger]|uniref:PH domain-containing protein n=1 Tax=Conger conger TaxID=82655 RepID=A0A9Q1DNR1_CONCO|nr:GRB2-associated-binding protein 2-like [Conger conger]KAJ8275848.1 hypothetical protein COCON_G00076000 [Conger conger]